MAKEHRSNLKREDAVENFLIDDSSSDDNLDNRDLLNGGILLISILCIFLIYLWCLILYKCMCIFSNIILPGHAKCLSSGSTFVGLCKIAEKQLQLDKQ